MYLANHICIICTYGGDCFYEVIELETKQDACLARVVQSQNNNSHLHFWSYVYSVILWMERWDEKRRKGFSSMPCYHRKDKTLTILIHDLHSWGKTWEKKIRESHGIWIILVESQRILMFCQTQRAFSCLQQYHGNNVWVLAPKVFCKMPFFIFKP